MEKYFKIPIEFEPRKLEEIITNFSPENKGYCCFVDSNLLVEANKPHNSELLEALNGSLVNSCDGSYVALIVSFIYKKKFKAYNGPEFFSKFIYYPGTHCIIGNTHAVYEQIKMKIAQKGNCADIKFIPLPFLNVDEFNYPQIATEINAIHPKYIWVSLGAPKQEIFMNRLLPFINSGIMLGVGAALNYFSGQVKKIPCWATKHNLIWFYRILTEPVKQTRRVLKIIKYYPKIYFLESRSKLHFNALHKHHTAA
jgi:N-acetylglucosaminyldiphosphoundecaprenol N-acetyl-beta-D-mannosaminyltransferase